MGLLAPWCLNLLFGLLSLVAVLAPCIEADNSLAGTEYILLHMAAVRTCIYKPRTTLECQFCHPRLHL